MRAHLPESSDQYSASMPAAVSPDIHIYTSSKLPWVTLPEEVPAVPEFYDARQVWPPETMARWQAARSKPK